MSKNRKITVLVLVLVLVILSLQFLPKQQEPVLPSAFEEPAAEATATPGLTTVESINYSLTATEKVNALEFANQELDLETKEYDFGVFIVGVNGKVADNEHFWAIYLNGESSNVGISEIELEAGDTIELKYEAII